MLIGDAIVSAEALDMKKLPAKDFRELMQSSPVGRAIAKDLKDRGRNRREYDLLRVIARIRDRGELDVSKPEVLSLFKKLQDKGLGRLFKTTRGDLTRWEWFPDIGTLTNVLDGRKSIEAIDIPERSHLDVAPEPAAPVRKMAITNAPSDFTDYLKRILEDPETTDTDKVRLVKYLIKT